MKASATLSHETRSSNRRLSIAFSGKPTKSLSSMNRRSCNPPTTPGLFEKKILSTPIYGSTPLSLASDCRRGFMTDWMDTSTWTTPRKARDGSSSAELSRMFSSSWLSVCEEGADEEGRRSTDLHIKNMHLIGNSPGAC